MNRVDGTKYRFFHNSDFSGDIKIVDIKTGNEICEIPFVDLKAVVASAICSKKIREIEQMDDDELLGL